MEHLAASPLRNVKQFSLPGNPEGKRQLTFLELGEQAPFPVRRIYWLHTLDHGELRGQHAHRTMQQLLVAVSGRIRIRLDDGFTRCEYLLDDPAQCLWLPPGLWREIDVLEPHAVLLALASTHFDEADYIRDYPAYLEFARSRASA